MFSADVSGLTFFSLARSCRPCDVERPAIREPALAHDPYALAVCFVGSLRTGSRLPSSSRPARPASPRATCPQRAATRQRFRKPRQDEGFLASQIGEPVGFAVGRLQREFGPPD